MRLVTTVVVPQLHDPVMLAKALATGDMLSGGRLTVGLGIGGRREDYEAVGADPATQTMRGMAERVAVMKRIWAGEKVTESVVPVGPAPVQKGGPQLLVGTMGPKTVRSAAAWADGLAGTTLDLDTAKQNELYDVARTAWAQAGKPKPLLATSFWFALGDGDEARAQVHRHLRRYMNWIPAEYVDAMAPSTGWAGNEDELRAYYGDSRTSAQTRCTSSRPAPTSNRYPGSPTSSRTSGRRVSVRSARNRDNDTCGGMEIIASVNMLSWLFCRETRSECVEQAVLRWIKVHIAIAGSPIWFAAMVSAREQVRAE